MGGGRSSCRSWGIAARCPAGARHLCLLLTCALVCRTLRAELCALLLMLRCSWAGRDSMVGFQVLRYIGGIGGGLHVLSQWLELCQGFGALSMINQKGGGGGVLSHPNLGLY